MTRTRLQIDVASSLLKSLMKKNSYLSGIILAALSFMPMALTAAPYIPSKAAIKKSSVMPRKVEAKDKASAIDYDLYKATVLISENFDKFTAGTPEAPDTKVLDGFIANSMTQTPGWSAYYVYQAGGCVRVARSENNNANISTPVIEIPNNGKPVYISFKAKLSQDNTDRDWAEVYMSEVTDGSVSKVFYNDYEYVYDEWKEYNFEFKKQRNGTQYFFSFNGYDADVLIDDIKIMFLDEKVKSPVAEAYSNFKTDGFTANWQAVEGADSYLVSLYTINNDRDKTRNYIEKDRSVTTLSTDFTGLDTPNNVYYYVVQTVIGGEKSPESNAIRIHDLVKPTSLKAENDGHNGVKLTWDAVPGAQYYEIEALREHTASTDETVTLIRENFDGMISDGTIDEPDQTPPASEELDEFTETPGWIATYPAHVNGAYCIIGYFYQTSGQLVYLESPLMDMSANDGKIDVSVDLYARTAGAELESFRAILRTMKLENNRLITTDSYETERIPEEWTNVKTTLKGGTANSVFEICSRDGWLYIDNIKITQELKAGEKIKVAYLNEKSETPEITLPVNDLLSGQRLVYRIRAVKEVWDEHGFSCDEYVRSPYTAYESLQVATAGIEDIVVDGADKVSDVYNLQGIVIKRNASANDIDNLPAGVYIINGKKVAVK